MKTIKDILKKRDERCEAEINKETENLLLIEKGHALNYIADILEPNNAWLIANISRHLRDREKRAGDCNNHEAMYLENIFYMTAQYKSLHSLRVIAGLARGVQQGENGENKENFSLSLEESPRSKLATIKDGIINKLLSCNDYNLLWLVDQLVNELDVANAKENSEAMQRYLEADLFKKIISISSGERESIRQLVTRFIQNAGEEENS